MCCYWIESPVAGPFCRRGAEARRSAGRSGERAWTGGASAVSTAYGDTGKCGVLLTGRGKDGKNMASSDGIIVRRV